MDSLETRINNIKGESNGRPFAIFDFDNTCIVNDIGEATFSFICKHGLIKDETLLGDEVHGSYHMQVFRRYHELLAHGDIRGAYVLCARILSGFTPSEAQEVADAAISEEGNAIGTKELFGVSIADGLAVRPRVMSLMNSLQSHDVRIWIMTSSAESVVTAAMKHFKIKSDLIAVRNVMNHNVYTVELHTPYPIMAGKVDCMRAYIDPIHNPLLVVDDSVSGLELLETAMIQVVVETGGKLTTEAHQRGWYTL